MGRATMLKSPQPRSSANRAKPTAPVGATMRPRMVSITATPTLLGQRRVRGTDRSLREATHSHNDIRAKMPRKMPKRTIASLRRSSLVISQCSGLAVACAAAAAGLHRWAFHRTVRTEDTAVAGFGFEPDTAAGAVPEEYARVCRHRLRFPQAALRAGDGGFPHRVHIPSLQQLAAQRRLAMPFHTAAMGRPSSPI